GRTPAPPLAVRRTRAARTSEPGPPCRGSCTARAGLPPRSSRERLEQRRNRTVDIAGADRQDDVSRARKSREPVRTCRSVGHPGDAHTMPRVADRVDDELAGGTAVVTLTGGVHVHHGDSVCRGERPAELVREVSRA